MAQNRHHSHQVIAGAAASDDGHNNAPPTTTVAFSSLTSAAACGSSSSAAGNMGKNLIPDLNMEERDSADGIGKDKPPRSETQTVEVAAADADADDVADKGKSVAAAVAAGEVNNNIALERERRRRMKDLFRSLQDLMPHVPQKTDKVALVGEAITYIRALEEKADMLGKQVLARRQADAGRGEGSSSLPQTAQGMAALSASDVPPRGWRGVAAVPPPAASSATPPMRPASSSPPLRFKTWTGPNVVLTVANDSAYLSVCAPRRANTLTMVTSVLGTHGIDVITVQVSSDSVRVLVIIFAHISRTDGANRSSEQVYQRAVSEIMYRLHSNNNNN